MCGITACIGTDAATEEILTGLENLEYRGYDSAGIAVRNGHGLAVRKCEGHIEELESLVRSDPPQGSLGIGHTRWSTHGPPTDFNSHPHTDCSGTIAVVHNGIIDNFDELRRKLEARGHEFTSGTDTEVIPHLVESYLDDSDSTMEAFRRAVGDLRGSYAIAMIHDGSDAIYATRSGSPLVLGLGEGSYFLASDVPAFLEFTKDVVYLEDGDVVRVDGDSYRVTDGDGYHVDRPVQTVEWSPEDAEKGGFDHYMLKEIHEQPTALQRTIRGRVGDDSTSVDSLDLGTVADVDNVLFVACGTSYHAGLYGSQLFADRGMRARAVLASEFASNPLPVDDETLVVGVTQSGETADTLSALREARSRGCPTVALTNVMGSTAARECDHAMFIRAGPEIGVAATKTFSSQVAALTILAEALDDRTPGTSADPAVREELQALPEYVERTIDESRARSIAKRFRDSTSYFFVGRGVAHAVALEGALKLKEISYEHAEGFAAGELKHGPLALVTEETPVFVVATGRHPDKTRGTVEEIQARNTPVVAVTDTDHEVAEVADEVLEIPSTHPDLAGVLANVQMQLLSYHVATLLDRPIDKPRNLAKSVTVE